MKLKGTKRAISLILSLCMLISLLPATVLFAGAEAEAITYDFTYASRNITKRTAVHSKDTVTAAFATYPKDDQATPDTDAKDQWIYLGVNSNYSGTGAAYTWARIDANVSYIVTHTGVNYWPVSDTGANEGYMAFQIYVPAAGTYDLSLVGGNAAASKDVDIYLGKTTDILNKDYFTSARGTETTMASGTNPYTNAAINTKSNVVRTGAKKFSELGIPSDYLKGNVDLTKTEATKLTNTLVAEAAGDYLLVMHNKGSKDSTRMCIGGLTLTPKVPPKPTVTVSAGKTDISIGGTTTLTSVVKDADGTVLNNVQVTYSTDDKNLVSVDEETGVVTGFAKGTAKVTATATVEGKTVTGTTEISVIDKVITYKFVVDGVRSTGQVVHQAYDGTFDRAYKEYPASPADTGANWAYLGTTARKAIDEAYGFAYTDGRFTRSANANAGEWLAFKIKVPQSGTYTVSAAGFKKKTFSAGADLYIAPLTDDLKAKLAEGNTEIYGTVVGGVREGAPGFEALGIPETAKVGGVAFNENLGAVGDIISGVKMPLTAGDNVVLFKATAGTAAGMTPASLTLTAPAPKIELSSSKPQIFTGNKATLTSVVKDKDGNVLNNVQVTYSTDDEDLVLIDENGVVIGLKEGTATIRAKAQIPGEELLALGTVQLGVADGTIETVEASLEGGNEIPSYATRRVNIVFKNKSGIVLTEFDEAPAVNVTCEINGEENGNCLSENDGVWYFTAPTTGGLSELSAKLTITATDGNLTDDVDITVVNTDNDKHVIIDFTNQPITNVADATLEEHGWRFVSWDMTSKGTTTLNLSGLTVIPRKAGKGVIEVKIPRSGYYSIAVAGKGNGVKAAEDVDIYLDGIYAGDFCFYKNGTSNNILPETFRTFYLKEGTHTLTFDCQPNYMKVYNPNTGEMVDVNNTYYGQPYSSIAFFAQESVPAIDKLVPSQESYEVGKGDSLKLSASLLFENGVSHELMKSFEGAPQDYALAFELIDGGEYIDLADDGTVTAKDVGTARVKMTVADNTGESFGTTWSCEVPVVVNDYAELSGVEITASSFVMRPDYREQVTFNKKAINLSGGDYQGDVNWDSVDWTYDTEQTNVSFTENADGTLSASINSDAEEGVYIVSLVAVINGKPYNAEATLTVTHGKAGRTFYTDERVRIARENVRKYDWAKKEKDAAVANAEKYVSLGMEGMWSMLVGEGLPRSIQISSLKDEITTYVCRRCGEQVAQSGYPWIIDPIRKPWKVECPECGATFPSNDFGSFYELGLGNDGVFDRNLALKRHHNMIYHAEEFDTNRDYECDCEKPEMVDPTGVTAFFSTHGEKLTNWYKYYGYGQGYLKNESFPDVYDDEVDPFRKKVYGDDCVLHGGYGDVTGGMIWCVDDGYGYATCNAWKPGATVSDKWLFIALYNHCGFWWGGANEIFNALEALSLAYIYTDDPKYGRVGAVLVDRLADLYPEYSANEWVDSNGETKNWSTLRYAFSSSGFDTGKISNDIWDANFAITFSIAYDAFWPMYDNPEVQRFLEEKEEQYPGIREYPVHLQEARGKDRLPKNSNKNIRDNIEKDLLCEIYNAALSHDVNGNFGMHQAAVARAALVYDREPYTREMIDWLFKESQVNSSDAGKTFNSGGELLYKIVNQVSRDGQGTESSSSYNYGWVEDTLLVATALGLYEGEITEKENLWRNPKYLTMLLCYNDMMDLHRGTQSIGDQGIMGSYRVMPSDINIIAEAYRQATIYTEELEKELLTVSEAKKAELEERIDGYREARTGLAQLLYEIAVNGKNFELEDLHYDIFTENPEDLYDDLAEEIETYGERDYDRSSMMTGYGFASLRGGALYKKAVGVSSIKDTTRDFWMYFGGGLSHMHYDMLNLGIDAYGISISSDNGYPERTGHYPSRHQWNRPTLSHNAVVINETSSIKPEDPAKPLHFDNKDTRVRLMDVDGSATYQTADDYRRTVLMIDYDDEISYGVDFFKVLGGEDHIYSFHASSNEVTATTGLDSITHQTEDGTENTPYKGTYAGANVPFGDDPWTNSGNANVPLEYPSGYTWLEKIRKDNDPDQNFSVDYKITDLQRISRNNSSLMDVHLKVTTANDWTADEVTLAQSVPSRRDNWDKVINRIEYMLIRRKAQNNEKLDTLYTTVFEPYNKTPYIKSIDRIEMVPVNGEDLGTDKAAAVRVELFDGRVDYVMYSTRNDILYTVTDNTAGTATVGYSFSFKGFAGVWTVKPVDGRLEKVYSYLHDGTVIGDDPTNYTDAITGTVDWHTEGLSLVNKIEVTFDEPISQELIAKLKEDDTSLSGRMLVGETTAPGNEAYIIKDAEIAEDGRTATINFGHVTLVDSYDSYEDDTYNYYLNEGTRFTIPMSYEDNNAPEFEKASYDATATAGNSVKAVIKAKSQVEEPGDTSITYKQRTLPRGASFNVATGTFTWKPDSSQIGENLVAIDATDSLGRTSTMYFTITVYGATTGGDTSGDDDEGSGGGGGGGGGAPLPDEGEDDTGNETGDGEDVGTEDGTSGEDGNTRFIDLGNYAWAADAINSLADAGIIKGTSENEYSPANNITRADFAILLVRAFNQTSDNTENFDDVKATDYFAHELAVARNTGIVGGIGNNMFAPRKNIMRQDMMLMTYRALKALGIELEAGEVDAPDLDKVDEYALDAVKALISNGLVNGKNGYIDPRAYTTRAEVAVLLKRILDFTNK